MRIALVGYQKQEKFAQGVDRDEDTDLLLFLESKGLEVVTAVWNDHGVDWAAFNVVVIKSPWDYHNHLPDFLGWLDSLEAMGIRVLNPVEVIRWNSHKKYLQEIASRGLPVIVSKYLQKGENFNEQLFDDLCSDRLVLKPCVSAGAQDTIVIDRSNYEHCRDGIDLLLNKDDIIAQPFVDEIKAGEWSFLFFNGAYSHCVLKTPKSGDFRVQHYHGGHISYPTPDPIHIAEAKRYIDDLEQQILYARVDGVIVNGEFRLMELELIEPYLFFNGEESLMQNYYDALLAFVVQK
ncbi:ATP-grasp domain-containing protein [Sphingobacterium paucimobilis]|uniref:Prokaryotic glutathione synthetase ATP-binding domain-containing protein n=1 Tax=Sphingobacterium paucimobilis HER1398 TaxID=1346330 RepID=U2HRM9_9SPHI|nr:hypothetical protein [Sphingobacterium paucimobilis]ERJ58132.1 hypothetical protein M472_05075 [Sphingobacterium paucimobilis HER1398]